MVRCTVPPQPTGISFTGSDPATLIMKEVAALLAPIDATALSQGGYETDTEPWGG